MKGRIQSRLGTLFIVSAVWLLGGCATQAASQLFIANEPATPPDGFYAAVEAKRISHTAILGPS